MLAVEAGEEVRKAGVGVQGVGVPGQALEMPSRAFSVDFVSILLGAPLSHKWILRAIRRS